MTKIKVTPEYARFAADVRRHGYLPAAVLEAMPRWSWHEAGKDGDIDGSWMETDASEASIGGYIGEELYNCMGKWLKRDAESKTLRINSYGGNAAVGIAAFNLMRDSDYDVKVVVDGLAFSAAGLIAMGGAPLYMPTASTIGIHQASVMAYGNKENLTRLADQLRVIDALQMDIITSRPKAEANITQLREDFRNETLYDGSQALAIGIADEIEDAPEDDAKKPTARKSTPVVDKPTGSPIDAEAEFAIA